MTDSATLERRGAEGPPDFRRRMRATAQTENDVLATNQRTSFSHRRDVPDSVGKHELAPPTIHRSWIEFTGFPLFTRRFAHLCNRVFRRLFRLLKANLRATLLEVAALGFIQRSSAGRRQVLYSIASLVSA